MHGYNIAPATWKGSRCCPTPSWLLLLSLSVAIKNWTLMCITSHALKMLYPQSNFSQLLFPLLSLNLSIDEVLYIICQTFLTVIRQGFEESIRNICPRNANTGFALCWWRDPSAYSGNQISSWYVAESDFHSHEGYRRCQVLEENPWAQLPHPRFCCPWFLTVSYTSQLGWQPQESEHADNINHCILWKCIPLVLWNVAKICLVVDRGIWVHLPVVSGATASSLSLDTYITWLRVT